MFLDCERPRVESPLHTERVEDPGGHNLGPEAADGVNEQLHDQGWEINCRTPHAQEHVQATSNCDKEHAKYPGA